MRTLAARKWALPIPFSLALRSASSIASGTISTPQTSPALAAIVSPIVPIPQKRSKTFSLPVRPAYSAATA